MPAVVLALLAAAAAAPVRAQSGGVVEVSNVAEIEYLVMPPPPPSGGSSPPGSLRRALSNEVRTVIEELAALEALTLRVDPAGTVAPGQRLVYTLTARNGPDEPLSGVRLTLPLHAGLDPPSAWTDGSAALSGGGSVPVMATYDASAPALIWQVPALGPGQQFALTVTTNARSDLTADSLIFMRGRLAAAELLDDVQSNEVATPVVAPVISVRKAADRSSAAPGDAVGFEILVTHGGSEPTFSEVSLLDALPVDLGYVEGSLRVDGTPVTPLRSADGLTLSIPLGPMAPGDSHAIKLATIVGTAARVGDVINSARVEAVTEAGAPLASPPALASVRIVPGPFRREAYLLGRVFLDHNGDGRPGESEAGVPGVLVTLEDGRGAVTDITGRWHLEGVRPGLHVARLDPASLAAGLTPVAAGAEWGGDAKSRFIEARAATLVVADFPVSAAAIPICQLALGQARLQLPAISLVGEDGQPLPQSSDLLDQAVALLLQQTRGALPDADISCPADAAPAPTLSELQQRLSRAAQRHSASMRIPTIASGSAWPGDPLGAELSATPGPPGAAGETTGPGGPSAGAGVGAQPATGAGAAHDETLELLLRTLPPVAAILTPVDGERASRSQVSVEVTFPADASPTLLVNGREVPAGRIGTRSVLPSRGIAAARYIGVRLDEGPNLLRLRVTLPDGTAQEAETRVYLPGPAVSLDISVPEGRWLADGKTSPTLSVIARDGSGQITNSREIITLMVEGVRLMGSDLDADEEGWQVRLRDGRAQVRFAPLLLPGRARVEAFGDAGLAVETVVPIVSGAESWTVVGLAEGRLAGDAGVEGDGGLPPGIEDDISDSGGRLALLARGPVGEASRLTVSIDTGRERDQDRLFDRYQADEFFPAAGDASVRVDQAQTQGPVFVRLDAPRGFAQYGDFNTDFRQTELTRYDRNMTGLSGEHRRRLFSVSGFAVSGEQVVARDLFEPDGTSGPYLLSRTPVVARSETVILETRDRWRTEEVLSRQVKVRDIDYALDPISGTVLFRAPILPFDPMLNPVRIVVLYETLGSTDNQVTAGGRVAWTPTDTFQAGTSLVREERDGDPMEMAGLDLLWRPRQNLRLASEVARTDEGEGGATAYRLELSGHQGATMEWSVAYRDLPLEFANPTLLGSPELGTRRSSATLIWRPTDPWKVRAEALLQDDERTDFQRQVLGLETERRFRRLTALGAVRSVQGESPGQEAVRSMMVEAGLRATLAGRWILEVLRRQALGDEVVPGYPSRTSVGLAWEIRPDLRAVLRHEIESGDGADRDRTLIGLESRIGRHTNGFARYALQQGADGATLRSTTGVETLLPLTPASSVSLSLARVDTDQGDKAADFTTLGGGYEYRSGAALASGRYELRIGTFDLRHLLIGSVAVRPAPSWTLFARERLSLLDPDAAGSALRAEGLMGAAYRPLGGFWRVLGRIEHSTMSGRSFSPAGVPAGSNGQLAPERPGLGIGFERDDPGVSRDSFALTLAAGARVKPRQRIAASLIWRMVDDGGEPVLPATLTDLVSTHYTATVHERWTVGGSVRRFAQEDLDQVRYGAGLEIGYLAMRNLWITGGYNLVGFENANLPGAERTERGGFVSFRFKFDEKDWIPWRDARLDRPDAPTPVATDGPAPAPENTRGRPGAASPEG